MREELKRELRESLYVHRPLPLHPERSLEAALRAKPVLASYPLFTAAERRARICASGRAELRDRGDMLTLCARLRAESWPEGASPDGDYCNYGTARLELRFPETDLRAYNRLRFFVRPRLRGARILHVNAAVENHGEIPLPDRYWRVGATVFDIRNGQWNECVWECPSMPRDALCTLYLYVFLSGCDTAAGEELFYDFRDVCFEKVETPEHEHGWESSVPRILLSSAGYFPEGKKSAVAPAGCLAFRLLDAESGDCVFAGRADAVDNERGRFSVLDFSAVTKPGLYRLQAGTLESEPFPIAADLVDESLWKLLNFLYCERCGFPVPGQRVQMARRGDEAVLFAGGWHDAGDVSQQSLQTAETVLALFENARCRSADEPLYLRLMEEAQWGLDFILRTRFSGGFRATSAGATRYTDNRIGSFDDVAVRVHDHAFENFLFSGVETYAALTLRGYDDELAANALAAAREDFAFARAKFATTGVDPAHMYEHTYNSGLSQYYAVTVWAASLLYEACGGEDYAACARETAEKLLDCQETGDRAPLRGFFYRDESHRQIVHFNHQSREHQFMQALDALCRSQPDAAERPRWEAAMRLYGAYLKAIAPNTAPYGMLPAGIHRLDEAEDRELFPFLHVGCDFDTEKENYAAQLAAGKDLGGGCVLRNFPVWFSFRGNAAVHLSMGKAASLLGRYFEDEELLQLGREQQNTAIHVHPPTVYCRP